MTNPESQVPDESPGLKEQAESFRRLTAAAQDAILLIDDEGRITHWNAAAERIFGYREEEVLGKDVHRLLGSEQDVQQARTGFEHFRHTGEGPIVGRIRELTGRRRGGEEFPIELSVASMQLAGRWTALGIVRDISERKRVEAALAHQAQELARSNAELEQFAYIASHDLQEPLRMVSSFVQLLQRRYQGRLDAEADEFIGFAVEGTRRMQALIQGLLAYSRVGSDGRELVPAPMEELLQEALFNLRELIRESGAVVSNDPLPEVRADARQFVHLLQNLIGNALKFRTDRPLQVHVGVRDQDDHWVFSVADNGIGFDPSDADRLFVPFQRLQGGRQYPGTGIGLAICRKVVERHGGRIWAESRLGQGSTFFFTVPRRDEE